MSPDTAHSRRRGKLIVSITARQAEAALARAELLYTQTQIEAALERMAKAIREELGNGNPILIGLMTGGAVTLAQLLIRLSFPLQIDYVHVTRYRGDTRGGEIEWRREPIVMLKDRNILLIDDILDEGHTLAAVQEYCRQRGAARVLTAVLVDKRHGRRLPGVGADFIGLGVNDRYVFGYGMDYKNYWRNLPAIYAVNENSGF